MATEETRKNQREHVRGLLKSLASTDASSLARDHELGSEINFTAAVPHFEQMFDVCRQLEDRDIARLSLNALSRVGGALDTLSTLVEEVQSFTMDQANPANACREINAKVAQAYDDFMDPMIVPLAFTATQETDYQKIEREAKGLLAQVQAEAEILTSFMKETRESATAALQAVQEQAAKAGVASNAQIFENISTNHKNAAKNWLVWTVVMSAVTLTFTVATLVTVFYYTPPDLPTGIQYVVAKLLVLSALSFLVFWSARNYKSEKHNETLNRHRANALMTFKAFYEGSDDSRVKDAILLQAAQAAFSPRPTGFDSVESETSQLNPVVDVLGRVIQPPPEAQGG